MYKKLLSLIFVFVLLTSLGCLSACNQSIGDDTSNASGKVTDSTATGDSHSHSNPSSVDDGQKDIVVKIPDSYFVKDSATDYVIVIPEDDSGKCMTAASELAYFLKLSSDVAIDIVSDTDLTFDKNSKYISIGRTKIFESSGISVETDDMKKSDYIITSKDKSVFILDNGLKSSRGTLYGVYGFLNKIIGYKAYAADEFEYQKTPNVNYMTFDIKKKMSMEARNVAFYTALIDSVYASRMGLIKEDDEWIIYGHTQLIHLMPYGTYGAEHPDYYTADGKNLCLSHPGVIDTLTEKVIDYALKSDRNRVMIGQPDRWDYCNCERCQSMMNEYGGYSGLSLWMVNEVANRVDKYLAENYPEREQLYYYIFAYQQSETPPVKKTADGNYTIYKDGMEVNDHVGIVYAPIGIDFAAGITDNANVNAYENLKGWATVLGNKNLTVWSYCTNFHYYFYSCNNFASLKDTYKVYADYGCQYIFDQGPVETGYASFESLRIYLQSQLMMDTSLNVDELVKDFMAHYYKDAKDEIYEYYTLLNTWYAYCRGYLGMRGTIYFPLDNNKYWPKSLVDEMSDILDKAKVKVEAMKTTDPENYEKVKDRVMHETISTIYIKMTQYREYYTQAEIDQMIADFEYYCHKLNIFCTSEMLMDVDQVISDWKE